MRQRVIGHRLPVVGAEWRWRDYLGFGIRVEIFLDLHRPARGRVDTRGPIHRDEWIGRQQLSVRAIQDIEKTVLGSLHEHLALHPVDGQLGERHLLHAVVVPVLAWDLLIMPDVFAGIGAYRHDRAQE